MLKRLGRVGGAIAEHGGRLLKVAGIVMTVSEFADKAQAEGIGQATNDAAEELVNPIGLNSREMGEIHRKWYSGFWDFLTDGAYDDEMKDKWNTLPENHK